MTGWLHRTFFWLIWSGCGFGIADLIMGHPWLAVGNAGWMMIGTTGRMWTETKQR